MVKFKCVRSGNTVSFSNEDDIKGLRSHEGYVELKETEDGLQEIQRQEAAPQVMVMKIQKANGRPRKNLG